METHDIDALYISTDAGTGEPSVCTLDEWREMFAELGWLRDNDIDHTDQDAVDAYIDECGVIPLAAYVQDQPDEDAAEMAAGILRTYVCPDWLDRDGLTAFIRDKTA
jgi:hypothetical protein